ncbi:MAG: type IV toxin-antitoxin system AbiEi family antitoxin domain-containing protein [Candidatus Woesearchaeota archaeon]
MSYKALVKKLHIERKLVKPDGIITSDEIKAHCKNEHINLKYNFAISYLLNNGYIERIMRGIFYIRTLDEKKENVSRISFYEAIAKAMKRKKVTKWYFGLESALALNAMTHETFLLHTIINNKIKTNRPIKILGHKVTLRKLAGVEYSFGILSKKTVSGVTYFYSDPERTVLDFVYLGKYNGKAKKEISYDISQYKTNSFVLHEHSTKYPKTVKEIIM